MAAENAQIRTFDAPCWAWIHSRVGIKRNVWVHRIEGQYCIVSYSRREAKRHPARVSDLRMPVERFNQSNTVRGRE